MGNIPDTNKNKVYFKLIAISLPFLLLGIIEGAFRIASLGNNMHLFVESSSDEYMMVNPYVGEKYFNKFEATSTTNDRFLKRKPENGFRIFVLGSSTVYGYPYDRNLMATRIMHKRLQDAYPDKAIEVVNTAITAINSITLKDFTRQILKHEPDAILFYAGHNEFYGAFGVGSHETISRSPFLRSLHFKLLNLRTYQLMRQALSGLSKQFSTQDGSDENKGTLMKRIVKGKDIVYKGEKYKMGIDQFQSNLSFILNKAKDDDVPVFLCDLVCNIKDLPPFGDIKKPNLSAATKFQEAENALSVGDTSLAKQLFYEAKDLDPVRFRASEEINEIIYEQAKQEGVILTPVKACFSDASAGGLIGDNLLTEHLHPNIDGQFLLADAFYTTIVESKKIEGTPAVSKPKEYYRQNWGYTQLDSLIGDFKIRQLKSNWPFASLEAEITFRDTFKTTGMVDSLAFTMLTNPNQDIVSLHLALGDYYDSIQHNYLALQEYEALIQINPYESAFYNKAANSLLKQNDLYAAEKYIKQSIQYNETYFAHALLGDLEFIKHDYNNAIEAFDMALELADKEGVIDEDKKTVLTSLYKIYHLTNKPAEKEDIRNKLTKLGFKGNIHVKPHAFTYSLYVPNNIRTLFNKAQSHFTTNMDSSMHYLLRCLQINDCPLVNYHIGNILFQKKDTRVLTFYNKAFDAYKNEPDFLVRLCVANFASNNKREAQEVLERLIEIDPNNRYLPNLKKRLNN